MSSSCADRERGQRRVVTGVCLAFMGLGVIAGCTGLLGDFTVADQAGPDASTPSAEGGTDANGSTCAPPARSCPNGTCAAPEDPRACGPSCAPCAVPTGGTAACTAAGVCEGRCPGAAKACDGACRDTTTDKDHCGGCGNACGGGDCVGGKCQPVVLTATLTKPTDIALSPNDVFVNADGKVRRCAKKGCADATALWISSEQSIAGPHMLAIDLNYAYFAVDGSGGNRNLYRCQLAGCSSSPQFINTTPAPTSSNFEAFAVEGTSFLFNGTYSGVREAPLSGGAVSRTYSNFAGTGFAAATPAYVVWSDKFGGGIRQCARSGGGCSSSTELTANVTATEITTLGDRAVFVVSSGTGAEIQSCNVAGCSGAPTSIAKETGEVSGLAADAGGIYWTTASGAVRACKTPLVGCGAGSVVELANGQTGAGAVALDAGFVYWLVNDGTKSSIRRVRR